MEEKYQAFEQFDWSDERWQSYLSNLYPAPSYKQILKFKKKWYRKTIDTDFDESYEPSSSSHFSSSSSGGGSQTAATGASTSSEGLAWSKAGRKAAVCGPAYLASLGVAAAAIFRIVDVSIAVAALCTAFVLEVLLKHGVAFSRAYLEKIVQEDVALGPFLAITMITPGMHTSLRSMGLIPPCITALMSLGTIAQQIPHAVGPLQGILAGLADVHVRYSLMQARANGEVLLGVCLAGGAIMQITSAMGALLYWNMLSARYATNAWTQSAFRRVDGMLNPVLSRVPGVSGLYTKVKNVMHGFATQERSSCSLL